MCLANRARRSLRKTASPPPQRPATPLVAHRAGNLMKKPRRSGAKSVMRAAKKPGGNFGPHRDNATETVALHRRYAQSHIKQCYAHPRNDTRTLRVVSPDAGTSLPASVHRETNTLGPHFASRGPSFQHEMLHAVTLAQPPRLCAGAALVAVSQTFVLRHRSSRTGRTGQATQGRCCTDAHGWHQRPALTP